ncbi:carbohydrate kinase family protein [Paenibacillus contaminans]|uniref:Carbohydrate kinase family protein n=1 Tax=Paenibacillus contaminans TaxID=450362 RepID=A0A329LT42_9BACL|nr:carbohydrate kinase family protein [Paenibacillus contaminans]RAV10899.1 carbohydrate kinase family protein [Paenibacillus contaminans]
MTHRVFILGELNVDLILTGIDILPEWNKEKLADTFELAMGSSSAITACVLAGLGADVSFVGVVGDDDYGRFMIGSLRQAGIDTSYVTVDPAIRTGVTISMSTAKDRALLTYMGSIRSLEPRHIPEAAYMQGNHIHFGSYFLQEGMRGHWQDVFAKARNAGVTTSFDTGWDPNEDWHADAIGRLLTATDLFIPSRDEFTRIFPGSTLEESAARLPESRGRVAVKCGGAGAVLYGADGSRLEGKPFRVTPVDTTGAGDSFNAGLIYGFLSGMSDPDMLMFANASGALATQRIGGAGSVPRHEDVLAFIAGAKTD